MKRFGTSRRFANATFSLLLAGALLLLAGCVVRESRASYFPVAWQEARVRWEQANRDRLISDVVFSRDGAGGAALAMGKHQTYLELLRQGETLRATGRMAHPSWRGLVASAPQPLHDWTMLLGAWEAARDLPGEGKKEIHTADFRVSFERAGGALQNMMVRPSGSGSTFIVRFTH